MKGLLLWFHVLLGECRFQCSKGLSTPNLPYINPTGTPTPLSEILNRPQIRGTHEQGLPKESVVLRGPPLPWVLHTGKEAILYHVMLYTIPMLYYILYACYTIYYTMLYYMFDHVVLYTIPMLYHIIFTWYIHIYHTIRQRSFWFP